MRNAQTIFSIEIDVVIHEWILFTGISVAQIGWETSHQHPHLAELKTHDDDE